VLSLKFNMRIYIATRSYNIVSGNEARGNSYALTSDGTVVVTVCRERYFYRLDRLLVFFLFKPTIIWGNRFILRLSRRISNERGVSSNARYSVLVR